jgi:hypothetical protein
MRRKVMILALGGLLLAATTNATPVLAQKPGAIGARMIFSFPGVFSWGGEADVGLSSHLALIASLQRWVDPGDCLLTVAQEGLTAPCQFDGLSLGGGIRWRVFGGATSTPVLQLETGRHRFEGGRYHSPFLSFRGGFIWSAGSRGLIEVGIKRQWTQEPVFGDEWRATTALQLSTGVRIG